MMLNLDSLNLALLVRVWCDKDLQLQKVHILEKSKFEFILFIYFSLVLSHPHTPEQGIISFTGSL